MYIRGSALNVFEGQCQLWHMARLGYDFCPNTEARIAVYRYLLMRYPGPVVVRHAPQIADILDSVESDVLSDIVTAWRAHVHD